MPAAGLKHTSNSLLIILYKAAQRSSPARLFALAPCWSRQKGLDDFVISGSAN